MKLRLGGLIITLLVGVMIGCARTPNNQEASKPEVFLAAAATASREAGTARMTQMFTTSSPSSPSSSEPLEIRIGYKGVWDFAGERGEMVFNPTDFQPQPKETEVTRIIFEKDAFYHPVPTDRVQAAGGKHWLRLEHSKFGSKNPIGLGGVSSPSNILYSLSNVAKDIRRVGEEEVRGVPCIHYTMKVPIRTLLEGLDQTPIPEGPEEWDEAIVPVDVWIGKDDNLLRKSVIDLSGGDSEVQANSELELYEYGVEVDIASPSPSDTYTPTDLEDYNRVMGYKA